MKKWWIYVLFLLTLVSVASAQYYYTDTGFGMGDITEFYNAYPYWFDFFISLIIFFSLSKIVFGGDAYKRGSKGLSIGLSLALSFGLIIWESRTGFNLGDIWIFALLILIFAVGFAVYKKLKESGMSIYSLSLVALLLGGAALYFLGDFLDMIPTIKNILYLITGAGFLGVFIWIFNKASGGTEGRERRREGVREEARRKGELKETRRLEKREERKEKKERIREEKERKKEELKVKKERIREEKERKKEELNEERKAEKEKRKAEKLERQKGAGINGGIWSKLMKGNRGKGLGLFGKKKVGLRGIGKGVKLGGKGIKVISKLGLKGLSKTAQVAYNDFKWVMNKKERERNALINEYNGVSKKYIFGIKEANRKYNQARTREMKLRFIELAKNLAKRRNNELNLINRKIDAVVFDMNKHKKALENKLESDRRIQEAKTLKERHIKEEKEKKIKLGRERRENEKAKNDLEKFRSEVAIIKGKIKSIKSIKYLTRISELRDYCIRKARPLLRTRYRHDIEQELKRLQIFVNEYKKHLLFEEKEKEKRKPLKETENLATFKRKERKIKEYGSSITLNERSLQDIRFRIKDLSKHLKSFTTTTYRKEAELSLRDLTRWFSDLESIFIRRQKDALRQERIKTIREKTIRDQRKDKIKQEYNRLKRSNKILFDRMEKARRKFGVTSSEHLKYKRRYGEGRRKIERVIKALEKLGELKL